MKNIYLLSTPWSIKSVTLFLTITAVFLGGFSHFYTNGNRNEQLSSLQNSYKISNFALIVSSTAAMLSAVRDDCGRLLPAVHSIALVVCNFRRKSSNA